MRTFIVYTILIFCSLFIVEKTEACFCKPDWVYKGNALSLKIDEANFIFIGQVTKITDKGNYQVETSFKIEKIYKVNEIFGRNIITEIDIFQNTRFYCDFDFEAGKKYFVFANESIDKTSNLRFSTNSCIGSKIYSKEVFQNIEKEFIKREKAKKT